MSTALGTPLKLLLVSTPMGPLGSGLGGGVELTLRNIIDAAGSYNKNCGKPRVYGLGNALSRNCRSSPN